MSEPATAPNRALSTAPAAGLSEASHQPPSTRPAARLTSSISGRSGCRASTIWPGRIRRVRRVSSQSPGWRAGSMERSATWTRRIGQCNGIPPRIRAGGRGSVGSANYKCGERESMRLLTRLLEPKTIAHAHCDLPCGVYDPAQARIEAESVKAIAEKYAQNTDPEFRARAIFIKEQRSELVKHHLWVLWTDYFKPPHFEKYPQLHQLFNEATKLAGASGTKGSMDVAKAEELLAKIEEINKIFWETKQA